MKSTPLTNLKPNPNNPRIIQEEKRTMLQKSLAEYGDLGSIISNVRTGNLIGGHQRVNAFKADPAAAVTIIEKLKEPDITGTTAYGYVTTNGTRYAYREVDWDIPRETAAMIAANSNGGRFDDTKLQSLLRSMDDMSTLGFTPEELTRLLPPPKTAPDEFPIHDENIPVQHVCPKCQYAWSGKPS